MGSKLKLLRATRVVLAGCVVFPFTSPVYAQEAGNAIVLDPIIIKANEDNPTGPVDGYVAPTTVTGSKTSTPLIEIPQAVSVITRKQLDDRGVQGVSEALNYTAGVFSEPFGGDPRFSDPIIRGFSAEQNIYLNSFRFIRDFGALAFEPYGMERIEVLKGPASVLYGQAVPGGIVNLIAKRPTFTEFRDFSTEVGSNQRYVGKFDIGGVVNEDVSYRLTGLGRLANTQQDYVEDNRVYIAPAITWSPDADTSLTVLASLQYDKGNSPLGLPQAGTLDPNPYGGKTSRSTYIGEPDFDRSKSLTMTLGYEFRHRFNETWEFRQNAQYVNVDFDYQNVYFSSLRPDYHTVNRSASFQEEDISSFGVDNQLEATFDTGPLEHKLLFGLDYRDHKQYRSSNFSTGQTPIDVYDPVYGATIRYNPASTTISNDRLRQTGLYAQDQLKFDKLTVTLGLRQDWSNITDTLGDYQADDSAVSGRAGAVYLFDNGLAPYVSYSTSFDPQVGRTTAGDPYKPSEGEQFELGVKYQPTGHDSFITASYYDLTRTNVVVNQAGLVGGNLQRVTTQSGEVRSRGFELEGVASLKQGLDLTGSYTYTSADIVEGTDTVTRGVITATTTGNTPANIPEHMASLWLNYAFQPDTALDGFSIGGGVRYIGKRYGNDANTINLPSATLFDAAIRYKKGDFKAALNVNNIADNDYVASCSFGCTYGEGRSVIGSLSYSW